MQGAFPQFVLLILKSPHIYPTFRSLKNDFLDINNCSFCLFCLTIAKPKSTRKEHAIYFWYLHLNPLFFCGYGQYVQIKHKRYELERLTNILKNHFPNCGMWAVTREKRQPIGEYHHLPGKSSHAYGDYFF